MKLTMVYDVPFGAPIRLPAPSYLCRDGKERTGFWSDVSDLESTSHILLPTHYDPSGWCATYATNPK